MTTETEKCVCVWYDSYSDPDDHAWIVSLDELDDRGRAETTHTLYSAEEEGAVIERAIAEGEKRGLPVYRYTEGQPRELISAAPGRPLGGGRLMTTDRMTLTDLARRLGKHRSTLSRHCTRLGLGTRTKHGIELTDGEVQKLAAAVALARPGNPAWRGKS